MRIFLVNEVNGYEVTWSSDFISSFQVKCLFWNFIKRLTFGYFWRQEDKDSGINGREMLVSGNRFGHKIRQSFFISLNLIQMRFLKAEFGILQNLLKFSIQFEKFWQNLRFRKWGWRSSSDEDVKASLNIILDHSGLFTKKQKWKFSQKNRKISIFVLSPWES